MESLFQAYYHGSLRRVDFAKVFPDNADISFSITNPFSRIHNTSISLYELCCILSIVKQKNMARILEIGTFDGNTALNLSANIPEHGRVVTVDFPLAKGEPNQRLWARTPVDLLGRQFKGTGLADKIVQVEGDSLSLNWDKLGSDFDLAFIDGNHQPHYVEKDTSNAIKVLKNPGYIIWHDYGFLYGVTKIVDSFAKSMNIYAIADTRLAVARYP
jgi:predicted O-methyltransferase YrrM